MTVATLEPVRYRAGSRTLLPVLVVLAVVAVAAWAASPYVVGVWYDDGAYALLAKSIATGHGFRFIGLPGEPAAVHQPPLYPLLLAAAWRLGPSFPDNLSLLLGLNAALLGIAALGLYRFATSRLEWREEVAALCAIVAMIGAPMLAFASALLSEPLFLAALWPALFAAERAATTSDRRAALAAGLAIGLLMLVRTHGVALLVALLLVLGARRRIDAAAVTAGASLLVVLPWQLWTMFATPRVPAPLEGAYGSYAVWLLHGVRDGGVPFVAATAATNIRELWLLLIDRVAIGGDAWLRVLAAALLAMLMLIGAWTCMRRAPVLVVFAACYLAIVVVWPYAPWRFVWAVWPPLLLFAAEGARAAIDRSANPATRTLATIAVAVPALAIAATEAGTYAGRTWLQPARVAGEQAASVVRWVGTYTGPGDVVLTEAAQVVTLFTGRRAAPTASFTAREYLVPADSARARAELRELMDALRPAYVVTMMPAMQQGARSLATGPHPKLREIGLLPAAKALVFQVIR